MIFSSQVINEVYYYVSHFLRVPFRDYPEIFQAEASHPDHFGRVEIDEIRYMYGILCVCLCVWGRGEDA